MLDPSSSEDSGGESDPGLPGEATTGPGERNRRPGGGLEQRRTAAPGAARGKGGRDGGASGGRYREQDQKPQQVQQQEEEKVQQEVQQERERIQKEEEERRIKLQIYVFVLRCIAHPFSAKQPTDMARRQQKVRLGSEHTCSPARLDFARSRRAPVFTGMAPTPGASAGASTPADPENRLPPHGGHRWRSDRTVCSKVLVPSAQSQAQTTSSLKIILFPCSHQCRV